MCPVYDPRGLSYRQFRSGYNPNDESTQLDTRERRRHLLYFWVRLLTSLMSLPGR